MKIRLAPKRSAIQPEIGRNTADASRYMVMAMLSRRGSTCRARAIAGSALLIEVAFSVCIIRAMPMIAGITQPRSLASARSGASWAPIIRRDRSA